MCGYKSFQTDYVAIEEGNGIGDDNSKTLNECETFCSQTGGCKSFALCGSNCHLKDKMFNGDESTKENVGCTTYYYTCAPGTYQCIQLNAF